MIIIPAKKRIESKLEVKTYLDKLKYAINNNSVKINFQKNRKVDEDRNKKYTNRYTISDLFPNEDEIDALKRELVLLSEENYVETVTDQRFPNRSEMRVFGKQYSQKDVYIKIRVELVSIEQASGESFILVMSFHYSDRNFKTSDFPYKKLR